MKHSAKCSIAIHSLLLIALYSSETKVTSDLIARSTGCNAVTIRNIFQRLRKHGLIEVKRGAGGAFLTRKPSEITLWEIYCAVEHDGVERLIGIHSSPYEQCPVGKYIQQVLADPYEKVGIAVRHELEQYTLEKIMKRFLALNPQALTMKGENHEHA